jgi:insertion element IS1 protein InsB
MAMIEVKCPICKQSHVVKHGVDAKGKQRFLCRNPDCLKKTFQLDYELKAKYEDTTEKIIEHAMNASGIRDTARVMKISPTTVIERLKQQASKLVEVNLNYLKALSAEEKKKIRPKMCLVQEAQADEMWSYVGKKEQQYWLWHVIDSQTGKILAYTLGRRTDEVYHQLRKLLRPFGIKRLYTDNWGAYTRHPQKGEKLVVSKKNTQRIESKHLNFRTRIKRLARKTICFSKSFLMHSVVLGLFINRYEFGLI